MGVTVRGQTIVANVEMFIEECVNCGVIFAMTEDFHQEKLKHRNDHNRRSFYCPNGHSQFYLGETEEQKLKREKRELEQRVAQAQERVDQERKWRTRAEERAEHERHRANGYKGHATRITKRVKAGVCICCNRTFKDLAAHMATKHPTLTPDESLDPPAQTQEKVSA